MLVCAAALTAVALVSGCADDAASADAPTGTSGVRPRSAKPPPLRNSTPTSPLDASTAPARLAASFAALQVGSDVGVALAPVGGGRVITLGDQTPRVAWSTIKVPLSLAAQRSNGTNATERTTINNAIINSDNDSALALRKSLGTPEQARKKVTAVLRDGGDTTTQVVEITDPDEETFGLTVWPLAGAARFASNFPCLPDTGHILHLMSQVAENQQWGLKVIGPPTTVAVKGGWGPGNEGGYEVRQLGVLSFADGQGTAVAMSTDAGNPMDSGTATLNKVSKWLYQHRTELPRGTCH